MSHDREQHLGELLDHALGEEMGLYFQPAWHPKFKARKRRSRTWRIALTSAAVVAAGVFTLPWTLPLPQGQRAVSNTDLAAIHLPKQLTREVGQVSHGHFGVASMTPVYGTYPVANPTGHNLSVVGNFQIGRVVGNSLSLLLNNHMQIEGGMLFSQGTPVYSFTGSDVQGGSAIPAAGSATPVSGTWYGLEGSSVNTVSAAGAHVYVTHGNTWADLLHKYWMNSPAAPSAQTVDSIAGLPASPDHALLLEENPSGMSRGFITTDAGHSWTEWPLGSQSVSDLIAIGSRYWAILNGTLAWSSNGSAWHNVLNLNIKRWQVETYAIDPANPSVLSVALIPISGDGIGPVLETQNGGQSWSEIPNFPAIGAAPSTMVMTTNGDIAALINANGPVIVRYSAKTQQWSSFPVPAQNDNLGLGQLSASPNGNLLYAAPGGLIYQWVRQSQVWLVIAPPPGGDKGGLAATPLQSVGNQQIMSGYPSGLWIFYESPVDLKTAVMQAQAAQTPATSSSSSVTAGPGPTH
ncbi:MAG: hypothetical protein M1272_06255 [Firmicutes bacterium]|nr:hypothetical protein [Bacillota bacterium]